MHLLLDAGAEVDARAGDEKTPLHLAAGKGYSRIARALLKAGAEVNAKDMYQMTPLRLAIWRGRDESVIKALVEQGGKND